jgi:hypothetical protein
MSHGANSVTFPPPLPFFDYAHSTIRRINPQGQRNALAGILFALLAGKQNFSKLLGSV